MATYLNVSEAFVYELAKTGQIPCGKIGRIYRFEWSEIQAWWEMRKRGK